MGDKRNDGHNGFNRANNPYSPYSRSAGVSSYRRRRRQGLAFKWISALLLVAIIGGAGFLFGRKYLEEDFPLGFTANDAQENQPEEVEVSEPTTVQPVQITLAAVGDVIMNGSVVQSGLLESGAYDFGHLFEHLAGELSGFDLRLVDQETGLAGSKFGFGNWRPLNAPQELGRDEADAGFNVILRASDHTLDNGWEGIHNELQWWESEYPDMPVLGIAEPDPEANPGLGDYVNNVYVFEKDGFKVAVLNHTWGIGEEDLGVVSALAEDKIADDVQRARDAGAEMIVACPHWGVENNTEPSEEETFFAQVYADHGVDVIIGSHPRVLQRIEVLGNESGHRTVCFYSLGCVMSSLEEQNLIGGMAEVTLSRAEDGTCSVASATLKPVVTHRGNGTDFAAYMIGDYSDDLAHSSWNWGLTADVVNDRCGEILGEGYDYEAREFRVAL